MKSFVIDASMALAWVHPSQSSTESRLWLDHVAAGAELIVPAIWPLEVSNALLVLQRRRKLAASDREQALRLFSALPVIVDQLVPLHVFTRLSELAARESLSVYDAAYLDLAHSRNIPLACKDGPLQKAAARNGVRTAP